MESEKLGSTFEDIQSEGLNESYAYKYLTTHSSSVCFGISAVVGGGLSAIVVSLARIL